MNDKRVLLGQLSSVYGVKGWIKVTSHTQPRENIFNYPEWLLKIGDNWQLTKVEQGRPHGKTLVVKLAGCDDRDQAQLLVNTKIAIYRSQLPPVATDEYYWSDLIGMQVITKDDQVLGVVDHLLETGANDVIVVKGAHEYLVPYIREQVVISVDLETRIIRVDWDPDF